MSALPLPFMDCHAERVLPCGLAARQRESKHLVFRMPREHRYYVYIVQSSSRRALYIGVTSNIERRSFQHKEHRLEGFTDQYNAVRLVYFERFSDIHRAIAREKQLKGWTRAKKKALIETMNPGWKDLSADWGKSIETQGPSTPDALRASRRAPLAQDDTP